MRVSVIGMGYVGSVAAAALSHAGHEVLGLDVDAGRVRALQAGNPPIFEPRLEEVLQEGLKEQRLEFRHLDEVRNGLGGVVMITVGTPSLPSGGADLSQVRAAIRWVGEHAEASKSSTEPGIVVMKSTVPPGTGSRLLAQELEQHQFRYVSNPEFLRQGQAIQDWFYPDRIVIGAEDPHAAEQVLSLYEGIEAPAMVTDTTTAEMIKYAANAFLATKVTFINEMANLCDRLGASVDDVARGIALDPRIGESYLRAGLGYGGSCFPKDVRALDFLSSTVGQSLDLMHAVITVNNRQRYIPIEALRRVFGELRDVPVAVLGLAFKPETDDVREAPAVDIITWLVELGAVVRAYDPAAMPQARRVVPSDVTFCEDALAALTGAQAAILVTEWSELVNLDWAAAARVMDSPRSIIDGRNALDASRLTELGFAYQGLARGNQHRPNGRTVPLQ